MQIATWNVNSLKVRLQQVVEWLQRTQCDILALQELKLDNDNYPLDAFTELGYNCVFNGQKTYNGVAIVSKHLITNVICDIPEYSDEQKRVITATIGGIRVMCVYVVNGENVDSAKFQYKLAWLNALNNYVANSLEQNDKFILLGDFNIAPDDADVYDPLLWKEQVLCSSREREEFNKLIALGLSDGFRVFNGEPKHYTWWDYRNLGFRRKLGLRIDHILISDEVRKLAKSCVIDIEPRKNERPSDHTPVVLTI